MGRPPTGKTGFLHLRIAPELKARITNAARRRFIETSVLVTLVLAEWLDQDESSAKLKPLSNPEIQPTPPTETK